MKLKYHPNDATPQSARDFPFSQEVYLELCVTIDSDAPWSL
jgi:hypothetical protein